MTKPDQTIFSSYFQMGCMKIMFMSFFLSLELTHTQIFKTTLKNMQKLFSLGVIYKRNIYEKDYD